MRRAGAMRSRGCAARGHVELPTAAASVLTSTVRSATDDTSEEFQVAFSKDSSAWGSWELGETTLTTAKSYKKFVLFAPFFKHQRAPRRGLMASGL